MKRVTALVSLLAVLSMVACETLEDIHRRVAGKRDFDIDPTIQFNDADLKAIVRNPSVYKNMDVRVRAMMNRRDESLWEPYYSGMNEESYYSFSVWPEGAKLWSEEGWMTSVATVFINKWNPNLAKLMDLKRFEVVELRARVRSDFRDLPWIEIYYLKKIAPPVYEKDALSGLVRAMSEIEQKKNAAAIQSMQQALTGVLPVEARFMAHYKLGDLFSERAALSGLVSDHEKAIEFYEGAVELDPGDKGVAALYEQALKNLENREIEIEREKEELRQERLQQEAAAAAPAEAASE